MASFKIHFYKRIFCSFKVSEHFEIMQSQYFRLMETLF